jgi:hypothetical protein
MAIEGDGAKGASTEVEIPSGFSVDALKRIRERLARALAVA